MNPARLAPGAYPVFGPTNELAPQAKQALESTAARGQDVAYFVVSGSGRFRVPCYRSWLESPTRRLPLAFDVVRLDRWSVATPLRVIGNLEREVLERRSRLGLMMVEVVAPPTADEASFIQLALTSLLRRHLPVLVLVHRSGPNIAPFVSLPESLAAALHTLHLAGGRMRDEDWRTVGVGDVTTHALIDAGLVDRRAIGCSTIYLTTGGSPEAELQLTADASRLERVAHTVQAQPWYPGLRIATRSRSLSHLLGTYSLEAVGAALVDDPVGLATYFHTLRRAARAAGDADLERVAAANQIATVLTARRPTPSRVWRALGSRTTTQPHPDTTSSLWFAVGQSLVQSSDAQSLAAAQAAFGRSREAAAQLAPLQRARAASRRAAIANGEALVAFKQGQFARARTLEESALDELAGAGSGSEVKTQRVLVAANLGDVLLRGLSDPETAIGVYRAALDDALASQTLDELRYLAPRLAAAELKRGNPLEAARVLRLLVARASRSLGPGGSRAEPVVLKAQLMLADAFRQAGQARLAAACYWALLRWPERLVPDVARAIAANLRQVHPDFKPRHARLIQRILADHDNAAVAATRVRAALSAA